MLDERAPLKTDPKLGHFPWWPEDGENWVHPEDVETARAMIPSPRIWRRDGAVGSDLVVMHYGETRIRVRRTLWVEAPDEGFEVGDLVEVLPRGMTNDPRTGWVRDREWNAHDGRVEYTITLGDGTLWPMRYHAEDLKHVERPSGAADVRVEPVSE